VPVAAVVTAAATADDERRACESLLIHNLPPDEPPTQSRGNKIVIARTDLLGAFVRAADGNILEAVCHREFRRFGVAPFDGRV
jgi:hypothetical protein